MILEFICDFSQGYKQENWTDVAVIKNIIVLKLLL